MTARPDQVPSPRHENCQWGGAGRAAAFSTRQRRMSSPAGGVYAIRSLEGSGNLRSAGPHSLSASRAPDLSFSRPCFEPPSLRDQTAAVS